MTRLTPDQLAVTTSLVARNWSTDRDEEAAARLVAVGVPASEALAVYQACREAYDAGFGSASGGLADHLGEPTDPMLLQLWEAGRSAAEAERHRRSQDTTVGYVVVGLFVLVVIVVLLTTVM